MSNEIHCPKCNSTQLHSEKKGFSGKKAVAGAVLTGGVGLLAGTIGSNKIIITCLACGHKFSPGKGITAQNEARPTKNVSSNSTADKVAVFLLIFAFIVIVGVIISESNSNKSSAKQNSHTDEATETISPTDSTIGNQIVSSISNWQYNEEEDKITSKTMYFAHVSASNPLDLKFPYEGAEAQIIIRYKNHKQDAVLEVTKGQFMANITEGQDIKVRFDSNKAETYSCSASSDDDSRYLFINTSKRFIDKIKHSKKVIIEAEMYDNGFQQMEFDTEGLVWNH